jgi:hypothetical protein
LVSSADAVLAGLARAPATIAAAMKAVVKEIMMSKYKVSSRKDPLKGGVFGWGESD